MTCGLPHLKRRAEFLKVARQGKSWATHGLVLQVLSRSAVAVPSSDDIRLGITASRKVGKAVVRNRVRRRLRAVAGEVLPKSAARGRDYVLIGRANTVARPFALLVGDLTYALRRLGVLSNAAVAASIDRQR